MKMATTKLFILIKNTLGFHLVSCASIPSLGLSLSDLGPSINLGGKKGDTTWQLALWHGGQVLAGSGGK